MNLSFGWILNVWESSITPGENAQSEDEFKDLKTCFSEMSLNGQIQLHEMLFRSLHMMDLIWRKLPEWIWRGTGNDLDLKQSDLLVSPVLNCVWEFPGGRESSTVNSGLWFKPSLWRKTMITRHLNLWMWLQPVSLRNMLFITYEFTCSCYVWRSKCTDLSVWWSRYKAVTRLSSNVLCLWGLEYTNLIL